MNECALIDGDVGLVPSQPHAQLLPHGRPVGGARAVGRKNRLRQVAHPAAGRASGGSRQCRRQPRGAEGQALQTGAAHGRGSPLNVAGGGGHRRRELATTGHSCGAPAQAASCPVDTRGGVAGPQHERHEQHRCSCRQAPSLLMPPRALTTHNPAAMLPRCLPDAPPHLSVRTCGRKSRSEAFRPVTVTHPAFSWMRLNEVLSRVTVRVTRVALYWLGM